MSLVGRAANRQGPSGLRPWVLSAAVAGAAVAGAAWWAWRPPVASDVPESAPLREAYLAPQVTLQAGVAQSMVTGNAAAARRSQAGLQQARAAFEQAVSQDERYAPAHAALANTLVWLSVLGAERPDAVLPRAVEYADRAVELDPAFAPGWQALAHAEVQWTRDWNRAELHYRRAIALNPNAEEPAFLLAHLLMGLGRSAEAVEQSLKALQLNPSSPVLLASTGVVHYFGARDADALRYLEQALRVDPSYSEAAVWRALSLAASGRLDEAFEWALRSRDQTSNAPAWVVGYVHALAGRRREAQEVLDALTAHSTRHYVPPMEFAYLTLALGQRERALQWIETSVREHSKGVELLAVDPILEPLRSELRFKAALASMKLGGVR